MKNTRDHWSCNEDERINRAYISLQLCFRGRGYANQVLAESTTRRENERKPEKFEKKRRNLYINGLLSTIFSPKFGLASTSSATFLEGETKITEPMPVSWEVGEIKS